MRRYIRHPSDIPIEISREESKGLASENMTNVSVEGLSFHSNEPYELGLHLKITISAVTPPFETIARVRWCDIHNGVYEIGVELIDYNDAFKARMVEQVCHIEHYKRQVLLREGRNLSGADAAKEWISKFAHDFPEIDELEPN